MPKTKKKRSVPRQAQEQPVLPETSSKKKKVMSEVDKENFQNMQLKKLVIPLERIRNETENSESGEIHTVRSEPDPEVEISLDGELVTKTAQNRQAEMELRKLVMETRAEVSKKKLQLQRVFKSSVAKANFTSDFLQSDLSDLLQGENAPKSLSELIKDGFSNPKKQNTQSLPEPVEAAHYKSKSKSPPLVPERASTNDPIRPRPCFVRLLTMGPAKSENNLSTVQKEQPKSLNKADTKSTTSLPRAGLKNLATTSKTARAGSSAQSIPTAGTTRKIASSTPVLIKDSVTSGNQRQPNSVNMADTKSGTSLPRAGMNKLSAPMKKGKTGPGPSTQSLQVAGPSRKVASSTPVFIKDPIPGGKKVQPRFLHMADTRSTTSLSRAGINTLANTLKKEKTGSSTKSLYLAGAKIAASNPVLIKVPVPGGKLMEVEMRLTDRNADIKHFQEFSTEVQKFIAAKPKPKLNPGPIATNSKTLRSSVKLPVRSSQTKTKKESK